MVNLISLFQSPQNGNSILHGGFFHHNRLKAPLQRRVLFNILPVFIQSSGADTMQFPPCQHGFQHIARIQRSVGLTCAHNGMQFVNKQYDLPVAVLYILQNGLQTFLKFPTVLGACHQSAHIQCKNLFVFQALWDVSPDNTLCQSFHHRRLAHAGLPDQHRIIFGLSGKNTDNVSDFAVPANHRIQFLISGLLHQFLPILFQCVISCLRIVAYHPLIASNRGKGLQETLPGNPVLLPDQPQFPIWILKHGQKQMFYGNILISQLLGLIFRTDQNLV